VAGWLPGQFEILGRSPPAFAGAGSEVSKGGRLRAAVHGSIPHHERQLPFQTGSRAPGGRPLQDIWAGRSARVACLSDVKPDRRDAPLRDFPAESRE